MFGAGPVCIAGWKPIDHFRRSDTGSVAVMAAFMLPAVAMLIGIAFDYNKITAAQRAYQIAVDDTVVSTRTRRELGTNLVPFARTHFVAMLGPEWAKTMTSLEFTRDADGIGATAVGRIPTPFFAVLRMPHFDLRVAANEKLDPVNARSSRTTRTR